jgi:hypothetical protein
MQISPPSCHLIPPWFKYMYIFRLVGLVDRPCGLVVRFPGYRPRGPGSIPGAARFSEK